MGEILIIFISLAYLALLFGIAYWVEHRRKKQKSVVKNGWVYALSLAVYCTGWTYYGSVGRATTNGPDFITIYLGPSIMCALFIPVLQKIIRICKTQHINSIADFISSRYGKNFTLGIVVTICCIIGIIPYIALQLKAISTSFHTITGMPAIAAPGLGDDKFYITCVIIFFIIVFGTRSVDATERHEGLVAAVAFESLIKLFAFLVVGVFITFFVFDGYDALFQAIQQNGMQHFFILSGEKAYSSWISMLLVSMLAMILLPRQFQVSVVENTNERHIRKAIWLFPLYLLAINIFVLPIAMGGSLILGTHADADTYVLSLPLHFGQKMLSVLVYIGGFSAATSMIIVETIALSTMVSNHLFLPLMFSARRFATTTEGSLTKKIILSRRIIIAAILFAAYAYNNYMAPYFSLVSIGLASMAAVAQFGPAVFGGLYWENASRRGAVTGIIVGFSTWFYTLIIPSGVDAGFISKSIMLDGPWGLSWLRPQALFGLEHFDLLSHSIFWSLLLNMACYVIISIYSRLSAQEIYQAKVFVHIFEKDTNTLTEGQGVWRGNTPYADIKALISNFVGKERTTFLLASYAKRNNISLQETIADPRIVNFSERILSGIIGSASAKFMVANIAKDKEEITIREVLAIVKESQQALELNKELKKKSIELSRATEMLSSANEQLVKMDALKDEFLYTVTHELRTPLTSIRALSEILFDNPDMEEAQRQYYLEGITREAERLSHLITQVLNLERYESGRQKPEYTQVRFNQLIDKVAESLLPLANEKDIRLILDLPAQEIIIPCDADLIRQVLYNLVSNAIKFSPERLGIVHISLKGLKETIRVSVKDNGPGVPENMRELIFDKFFQANNQTVKKPTGTGLGLTICKRIVEMHQGEIWVEHAQGGGASFVVSLPGH
jgi:Na+/proline symporter/signal transduction histidine kinase